MSSSYIFSDGDAERELSRLREIEAIFDPATRRTLEATGLSRGWRCLEVGAGAGSIGRWLAEVVGPSGRVVALDRNARFVSRADRQRLDVCEEDIRTYDSHERFDLVHARYVLIHVPEFETALAQMARHLKPDGWLIVEEPDFSAARAAVGPDALVAGFDRVNRAIGRLFASRSTGPAFGLLLPRLLGAAGLRVVAVENDVPLVPGGSSVASMMRKSAEQLRDQYIATGEATSEDVDGYCAFAAEPSSWGIYYGTVRVTGRQRAGP